MRVGIWTNLFGSLFRVRVQGYSMYWVSCYMSQHVIKIRMHVNTTAYNKSNWNDSHRNIVTTMFLWLRVDVYRFHRRAISRNCRPCKIHTRRRHNHTRTLLCVCRFKTLRSSTLGRLLRGWRWRRLHIFSHRRTMAVISQPDRLTWWRVISFFYGLNWGMFLHSVQYHLPFAAGLVSTIHWCDTRYVSPLRLVVMNTSGGRAPTVVSLAKTFKNCFDPYHQMSQWKSFHCYTTTADILTSWVVYKWPLHEMPASSSKFFIVFWHHRLELDGMNPPMSIVTYPLMSMFVP